jgi:KDO2-lipid IV(A) lauroyltransferase
VAEKRRGGFRRLVAALAVAYLRAARFVPLPVLRGLLIGLGRLLLPLVPRLRREGMRNLDLVYGDRLSRAEKWRILREAMDNMCTVAAELPHLPRIARQYGVSRIGIEGLEHLDASRGALLISAHLGNWEWMAAAVALQGRSICEVVRPLDDPRLDAVVDALRRDAGIITLPKDNAGTELIRRLKAGELCGVLVDQSPRENAVPTTFLGRPCWSTIAPAMIALRAKVPVHAAYMQRVGAGRYVLRIQPALPLVHTGRLLEDLQRNTQICQDAIEVLLQPNPGQWLWFHRRWKQRPRLEEEWEARKRRSADAGGGA